MKTNLKLALDWTPNTIHTGIYAALYRGYYASAGLEMHIISPESDGYSKYPIQKLADKEVDIAMAPSEHVIVHNLNHSDTPLLAIGAVFQQDTSCMIVRKEDGIFTPKDLDGKTYLGYQTRFEQDILRKMIQTAGGKGDFSCITPPKLSVWDAFLQKKGDVCWVFTSWEYAQAIYQGVEVQKFSPIEWGVPYGYSPCFHIRASEAANHLMHPFLEVTGKGYQWAVENIEDAAALLHDHVPHSNMQDREFLEHSIRLVHNRWLDASGLWGIMRKENWKVYLDWLQENDLLHDKEGKRPSASSLPVERFAHLRYCH
jgi:NitT/TauT family transport system substrate-binding protein